MQKNNFLENSTDSLNEQTGVDVKLKNTDLILSYRGSQNGITIRDSSLKQKFYFELGVEVNSIASGENDDLYITSKNHIYHYKNCGKLIKDEEFPDGSIHYTAITIHRGKIYIAYEGSQQGITIRDLNLNQISCFDIDFKANKIAVNDEGIYLTSANHIFKYDLNGNLKKDMKYEDDKVIYTGIVATADKIYTAYRGSEKGISVRDSNLNQLTWFSTKVDSSDLALGKNNNFFTISKNSIYQFDSSGVKLNNIEFPDSKIEYTSIVTK